MAGSLRKIILLLSILLIVASPTANAHSNSHPLADAAEGRVLPDSAYYPALLDQIRAAKKSIDLVVYIWKLAEGNGGKPAEVVKALGEARQRGVAVRVLLENSGYDENLNRANRETAEMLRREGIVPFLDSPDITTHAKLAIIDRRFCFVGSHNLTQSALGKNHEISLLLDNPSLAVELSRYMESLLKDQTLLPIRQVPHRSALH